MTKEKAKEPQIRFKGFTNAWEQRKLGELADNTYGGGTPNTSNDTYWNGEIPWIQSSDLKEHRIFGVKPRKHISQSGLMNSATKLVPENSIAIITRVGVGKLAVMPFSYTTSQDFLSLSRIKTDIWFTAYLLYRKLQRELNSVQGTSIKGITKGELIAKMVSVPTKSEQVQIGCFFRNLDRLITLHQRKCDLLCKAKKTLLQKMFPKNGETTPEIRFKGFTGAWEQRKVGDLFNERNEQYPMSEEYPLMAFIANIGVAPKGERYDRSALVNDEVGKKYKRTEKGDFIYSSNNLETGSIGLNNYGKACISPVYSIFKSKHNADSDFLGRMLLRKEFINDMVKFRQGVVYGQWKIHEKDFLNLDISVPLLPEQQQIGRCFRGLDHLITLHQHELEKLQNIKKSCLKMMFV